MCTFCSTILNLTKGKIESDLANTLSRWLMRTTFFSNKIIRGDETWCFAFDPETKRQGYEWLGETTSRPKKLKFQRSHIKNILIYFFDSQGIVHKEFVPEGKTVNAEFYKGVIDRLPKGIKRVRPAAFCYRDFFLLHDRAPAHKAASICQFLTPKNVTNIYPPHTLRQNIFCSPS